jgi:hypothetical protein
MSSYTEHLTRLRRQEQEDRGYAPSSRWYTGLSNAISFLERAEIGTDPLDRFRDAWSATYNLFLLHGRSGDDEHKCFNRWVSEVKEIPDVRRTFSTVPETVPISAFRTTVNKAKNTLLKPQGLQGLQAWSAKSASSDKACRYFFDIVRDMRNTCAHPDFNPKSAAVKQALTTAAACLVPMVASAIQAMIEQPVAGTTGRTTAYRSFLWPFLKNADSFFSDYYLERLFPEEELDAFPEEEARELLKSLAKQYEGLRSILVTVDAEETRQQWGVPVLFQALAVDLHEGVRLVTDDGIFEPSYVLKQAELSGKPRQEYQGKDAGRDLACLLWVLPWRSSLDVIATDDTSEPLPMMEVAHRALTHSDVPWAVLSNGQQLRLLARGTAHKPRCFLEIDLAAVVDRRGDSEALLAFRYCLGLFSGASFMDKDGNDHTRLDRVRIGSERHGKEIGDELKQNVFRALEELGDGFLHYLRTHPAVLEAWRKQKGTTLSADAFLASEQLLEDIYHESLSLMYRLLFLFYAESRTLLPMEDEIYRESYSLESIRDDIISVHDDPDPRRFFGQGDTQLWDRLTELFYFLNTGWGGVIPAYNGGLFDPELHKFLEQCKIPDYFLARAIDLLSRTQPRSGRSRGEGRKKVTYRDLDIRHLGSIYEGILEYSAHIADQNMVVMKRGSGGKTYEEYVPVAELEGSEKQQLAAWRQAVEENPDNPQLPRGCKVTGEREKGSYFLVYGGRESKRKSSGSYYTPDYIVQYIVQNTLGPLVRGECRPEPEPLSDELKRIGAKEKPAPTGPLSPDEILDLKVLDPAMGSGHFLVAATEFLARAYGEALLREGQIASGVVSDDEFIRHKRMIVERCIYGVDINPMAVELAKLSLWLFTMDRSRPLSFLEHHLKYGNSLIGAWLRDLGRLPEFDRSGKPKKTQQADGQGNLFEQQFRARVPLMLRDLFGIMGKETLTLDDIETKKALDKAVEEMKRPFKNIANAWVATFLGEVEKDYDTLLSNVDLARDRNFSTAEEHQFFHWELEFPEIFFDEFGNTRDRAGFDGIVGNPPWTSIKGKHGSHLYDEPVLLYLEETLNINSYMPNTFEAFCLQTVNLRTLIGSLSLIVPDRIASNDNYIKARYALIKNGIYKVIFKVYFPEIIADTLIFTCLGQGIHEKLIVGRYEGNFSNLSVKDVLRDEDFIIPLIEYPFVAEIWGTVSKNSESTLSDWFSTTSGFGGKSTHITKKRASPNQVEVRKGSDIARFALLPPRYFEFRSENITGRTTNRSVLGAKPKVLLRKTGDRLIAAFDSTDCLPEQSLYFLYSGKREKCFWCILALLNSQLFTFLYRTRFVTNLNTTPQLKKKDLDRFWIPKIFPDIECARIAKDITFNGQNKKLEKELNNRVYQLFYIPHTLQELIDRFLRGEVIDMNF